MSKTGTKRSGGEGEGDTGWERTSWDGCARSDLKVWLSCLRGLVGERIHDSLGVLWQEIGLQRTEGSAMRETGELERKVRIGKRLSISASRSSRLEWMDGRRGRERRQRRCGCVQSSHRQWRESGAHGSRAHDGGASRARDHGRLYERRRVQCVHCRSSARRSGAAHRFWKRRKGS
jgi:hypothetical protein